MDRALRTVFFWILILSPANAFSLEPFLQPGYSLVRVHFRVMPERGAAIAFNPNSRRQELYEVNPASVTLKSSAWIKACLYWKGGNEKVEVKKYQVLLPSDPWLIYDSKIPSCRNESICEKFDQKIKAVSFFPALKFHQLSPKDRPVCKK